MLCDDLFQVRYERRNFFEDICLVRPFGGAAGCAREGSVVGTRLGVEAAIGAPTYQSYAWRCCVKPCLVR